METFQVLPLGRLLMEQVFVVPVVLQEPFLVVLPLLATIAYVTPCISGSTPVTERFLVFDDHVGAGVGAVRGTDFTTPPLVSVIASLLPPTETPNGVPPVTIVAVRVPDFAS